MIDARAFYYGHSVLRGTTGFFLFIPQFLVVCVSIIFSIGVAAYVLPEAAQLMLKITAGTQFADIGEKLANIMSIFAKYAKIILDKVLYMLDRFFILMEKVFNFLDRVFQDGPHTQPGPLQEVTPSSGGR